MTDRELLNDVQSKLDALTPRVEALEAAAADGVTHAEVQAVVEAESSLESRVSALESNIFPTATTDTTSDTVPDPLVIASDEAPPTFAIS